MDALYALVWGVGQTIIIIFISFTRILATLWSMWACNIVFFLGVFYPQLTVLSQHHPVTNCLDILEVWSAVSVLFCTNSSLYTTCTILHFYLASQMSVCVGRLCEAASLHGYTLLGWGSTPTWVWRVHINNNTELAQKKNIYPIFLQLIGDQCHWLWNDNTKLDVFYLPLLC